MPAISVIVPVYKVESVLARCADSILTQRFRDFELILVDDGSPDRCGAICDEYAKKDPRVRVIHQKNGGLSAARNAGIDWATAYSDSKWLAFIDSDDWVHPAYLEYLLRAAETQGVKISVCPFTRVETQSPYPELAYEAETLDWIDFYLRDTVVGVVAWNKLYAKELFAGIRYPAGKIHEDQYTTYRLLDRAGRVALLSNPLYYYFQNQEGIMLRPYSLSRLDAVGAFEGFRCFARKCGYEELHRICLRDELSCISANWTGVQKSETIPADGKKRAFRLLRAALRRVLLQERRRLRPFAAYERYWKMAFPGMTRLRIAGSRIKRRMTAWIRR